MRALFLAFLLAACSQPAPVAGGNEQAVIDKANADVAAAQAEAAAQPAPRQGEARAPNAAVSAN